VSRDSRILERRRMASGLPSRSRGIGMGWLVLVLVALGAFLRFYRLGAQSLWIDEVLTIQAAELGGDLGPREFFANIQGPLHALIIHFAAMASPSARALRSVSAVLGTALIPVSYALGRTLVDRVTGLVAAVLVAVSPFAIWYSQEIRNYSLLMLFSGVATVVVWRVVTEPKRSWAPYVLAAAVCVYSNLSAAFLVAAHALFAARRSLRERAFMRRSLLAFVVVTLLAAPMLWGVSMWTEYAEVTERAAFAPEAEASELRRGDTTFSAMAVPYTAFSMAYGFSLGPSLRELHELDPMEAVLRHRGLVVPAGLALAFAFLLGLRRLAERRPRLVFVLLILLVPVVGTSLLAVFNIKPFNPRYLAVAFPAFVLTVAAGVGSLRRPAAFLLSGVFILFCLLSLKGYYFDTTYWKEDVRAAAYYVQLHEEPGDIVLVPVVRDVFNHYYDGSASRFVFYTGQAGSDAEVEARIEEWAEGARRLWYVAARTWDVDPEGRIGKYLEAGHELLDRSDFTGVSIYLYEMRGEAEDGRQAGQTA